MCLKRSHHSAEAGNILFLILLAVVLFAALSYAVTNSVRGGGNDASAETRKTQVARMLQYASLLENTITRLRLAGCSDTDISFKNNTNGAYNAHVAPASCEVFGSSGGGITWQSLSAPFSGPYFVNGNYVDGIGTTAADLLLILNVVDVSTCLEINNQLNITNPSGAPPVDTDISTGTTHLGTYPTSGLALVLDQTGGVLKTRTAGCLYETTGGGNNYRYYHVLLAR